MQYVRCFPLQFNSRWSGVSFSLTLLLSGYFLYLLIRRQFLPYFLVVRLLPILTYQASVSPLLSCCRATSYTYLSGVSFSLTFLLSGYFLYLLIRRQFLSYFLVAGLLPILTYQASVSPFLSCCRATPYTYLSGVSFSLTFLLPGYFLYLLIRRQFLPYFLVTRLLLPIAYLLIGCQLLFLGDSNDIDTLLWATTWARTLLVTNHCVAWRHCRCVMSSLTAALRASRMVHPIDIYLDYNRFKHTFTFEKQSCRQTIDWQ